MKNLNKTAMAILLSTLFLTACGGGSDSDITPPPISGGNGGGNDNGGDTGGGENGDGNNDPDPKPEPEPEPEPDFDHSKNGVFTPIVKDTTQHFHYETNSRLVPMDYHFEYFGTTEQMLYIKDFEWNGQTLTMPFAQFIAEIGVDIQGDQIIYDRYKEVFAEMFNECQDDPIINEAGGFRIRCGGTDVNGKNLTYDISISGNGEHREYTNEWLYDQPVQVMIRDHIQVTFGTMVDYVYDPTQKYDSECGFNSMFSMYREDMGNDSGEFKIFDTGTPDTFYCDGHIIL